MKPIPAYPPLPCGGGGGVSIECLKGIILGISEIRKEAWHSLLGLYGINKREETIKDPGKNVSERESGLYICSDEIDSNMPTITWWGRYPLSVLKK